MGLGLLRGDTDGHVRLDVRDNQDQYGKAALLLDNHRRELDAGKILVVLVDALDQHVAQNIVVDPGLHSLDEIIGIYVAGDFVFVLESKCDDGEFVSVDGFCLHRRIIARHRRLQKDKGRYPDIGLRVPRRSGKDDLIRCLLSAILNAHHLHA